jgi:hypothetical protein
VSAVDYCIGFTVFRTQSVVARADDDSSAGGIEPLADSAKHLTRCSGDTF